MRAEELGHPVFLTDVFGKTHPANREKVHTETRKRLSRWVVFDCIYFFNCSCISIFFKCFLFRLCTKSGLRPRMVRIDAPNPPTCMQLVLLTEGDVMTCALWSVARSVSLGIRHHDMALLEGLVYRTRPLGIRVLKIHLHPITMHCIVDLML